MIHFRRWKVTLNDYCENKNAVCHSSAGLSPLHSHLEQLLSEVQYFMIKGTSDSSRIWLVLKLACIAQLHLNQHLFTNAQAIAAKVREDVPELFATQDFDVTTALLYLSTGGWVTLQVFVIKGDLNKQDRVNLSFAWHLYIVQLCASQQSYYNISKVLQRQIILKHEFI